ncbi:menaquinone biosynthesis decarboxylase, SCO4490 family [Chlamydia ibidis]|uniref:Menaquinone biosynthesis decarboxylase, SCO4490 family n=2 Tax=Chlamydia ibidis TaxID=1405396 RepID=S7J5J9_9CHLA|nr:menaquinone biosynthesis decarboxylase [Chlamydia ibidis]EPP35679.1 menaquinone biosynthesis decarboxylase, SCO4490 family [Chlamydia ibidis]EQM62701.1 menaquinone biosynthesis decarboxylase, SCO4490 family [Chlamydia ibidis 10-1398/6]
MSYLRRFISLFRSQKDLIDIYAPVDPHLELAEVHRRVIDGGGPALLFHNVLGSPFPVITNLFGTKKRIDFLFAQAPNNLIQRVVEILNSPPKPSLFWKNRDILRRSLSLGLKRSRFSSFPFQSMETVDLNRLPMLTSWPEDGGAFLTLPLVYTESPNTHSPNLGMYRMQRFDNETLGLHFQIHKGGGMHLYEAEQSSQNLPVTVSLSGNPFLILSAIAPLPENISEMLFCSFLQGHKLKYRKDPHTFHPLLYDAEFILTGETLSQQRKPEGPFGDHFGYYSLQHDFPIFKCKKIYYKKDAIYPATVVGKPYQEDFYLGQKLQEYLAPLFPIVLPGVLDLKSYGETGFHALASAVVKERYWKESLTTALAILGAGQLSLTKYLLITDQAVDLNKISDVLETILSRMQPSRDLIIFSDTSQDTLDYTGTSLNKGSKAILMGVGKQIRTLPHRYIGGHLPGISDIEMYCKGCLVLETSLKKLNTHDLLTQPSLTKWPLVILTDNLKETLASDKDFLWRVFTRSAPATDLHVLFSEFTQHRPHYRFPIILNSLMKPSYPKTVEPDPDTVKKVSSRWSEYFKNK